MSATAWSLLSGLFGAFLVFVLGVLREWWRGELERSGLLRLAHAEIKRNRRILQPLREADGTTATAYLIWSLRHLETDDWDRSKVRLAQLIVKSEHFASLSDYYDRLGYLVRLGQKELTGPQFWQPGIERAQECMQLGDKAVESTATLVLRWWQR